jgi:hypothetical protein
MNVHDLIRDPLFQLNVLIWMAKEQPGAGYIVKPLFFQNGFHLVYIQQPFPFPPESIRAIQSSDLDVSEQPEPEVLLGRSTDQRALYFEAKAESFSPQSSNANQARGHLLATGNAFVEVLAPLRSCVLCYVVPRNSRDPMFECLVELTWQVAKISHFQGRMVAVCVPGRVRAGFLHGRFGRWSRDASDTNP